MRDDRLVSRELAASWRLTLLPLTPTRFPEPWLNGSPTRMRPSRSACVSSRPRFARRPSAWPDASTQDATRRTAPLSPPTPSSQPSSPSSLSSRIPSLARTKRSTAIKVSTSRSACSRLASHSFVRERSVDDLCLSHPAALHFGEPEATPPGLARREDPFQLDARGRCLHALDRVPCTWSVPASPE